jgi:hypothetical protein
MEKSEKRFVLFSLLSWRQDSLYFSDTVKGTQIDVSTLLRTVREIKTCHIKIGKSLLDRLL